MEGKGLTCGEIVGAQEAGLGRKEFGQEREAGHAKKARFSFAEGGSCLSVEAQNFHRETFEYQPVLRCTCFALLPP